MEKKMKLLRKFSLVVMLISGLISVMTGKEILLYGTMLIFVLVIMLTEKYMSDILRNNPYKIEAKIIKKKYNGDNDIYTIEYVVDDVIYTKKIPEVKFNEIKEYKNNIDIGSTIDVYTSKEIPSHILLTCEVSKGDNFLFIITLLCMILIIFAFIGLFIID